MINGDNKMNRIQKFSKLLEVVAHGKKDPDKEIQHKIFDALVDNGLPEEIAAVVVSNIGRMHLRALWKKIVKRFNKPKYGWEHSCGEKVHQFDSPGDPCPSCGEEDEGGSGWTYFDKEINEEE